MPVVMVQKPHRGAIFAWRFAFGRGALAGLLLSGFFCFLAPFAQATPLPEPLAKALAQAGIPAANVALLVQPVDGRAPLLRHRSEAAMNPASVMKLVTTYAALDLLGAAHTWRTGAWIDGVMHDGRLAGNLVLVGGGDPHLAIEDLWAMLRALQVRGLKRIDGDIILDRSAFAVADIDPGAFDGEAMRPYNIGPDALLINFRALRFTLEANPGGVRLWQETPSAGLAVENRLQLAEGACPSDWRDRIQTRLLAARKLEFSGSFHRQCGEKSLYLAPFGADAQVDGLIRSLWAELGGELAGQVRAGKRPENATLLAQHESSPLATLIRDINKFSNNVMARQLFLALAGSETGATADLAGTRLKGWLAGRGLDTAGLVLENGSGLSRRERISAAQLGALLQDAWRHPAMPEYVASLPLTGIDGTMKKRLRDTPASGRGHIKTGTLDGVKTAAGYALDALGRWHVVVVFINHPRAAAGQGVIDALLLWLAERRT